MKDKVGLALAVGVIGAVGLLAAGCGSSNATKTTEVPGGFNVTQVPVQGKMITCITWEADREGGLSCDWAHPK